MKELNFAQEHLIGLEVCSYIRGSGKIMSINESTAYPIRVDVTVNGEAFVISAEPEINYFANKK